jgi:hypothetical protein
VTALEYARQLLVSGACDAPETLAQALEDYAVQREMALGADERQLLAHHRLEGDYVVMPCVGAVQGFGIGNVEINGQAVEAVVLNVAVVVPAANLRRSRLVGLDGRPSNPLQHTPPMVRVRLLVRTDALSDAGKIALHVEAG